MDKLERAKFLGIYVSGWRFMDYCLDAIPKYQWIDCVISGEKGAGKSNKLLQDGYRVFHGFDKFETLSSGVKRGIITDYSDMDAWQKTLDHLIFRPYDFGMLVNSALKEKRRLSWIGADDFNLHWPRSLYSTNRRLWEDFARNWEVFRAQLSIFECTVPRKDTVISVILRDINYDCLVSNKHKIETYRWFYDISFFDPNQIIKMRLDIESEELNLYNVPSEVWRKYWDRKQELVDEENTKWGQLLIALDPKGQAKQEIEYICSKCGRDCDNEHNLRVHEKHCAGAKGLE